MQCCPGEAEGSGFCRRAVRGCICCCGVGGGNRGFILLVPVIGDFNEARDRQGGQKQNDGEQDQDIGKGQAVFVSHLTISVCCHGHVFRMVRSLSGLEGGVNPSPASLIYLPEVEGHSSG